MFKPVEVTPRTAYDDDDVPLRTELTVCLQPFVTEQTVKRAMVMERFRGGGRGRLGPSMTARTLATFEFVELARNAGGGLPPWGQLVKQWDEAHPEWSFNGDRRHLWRDYVRAHMLLLGRPPQLAGPPSQRGPARGPRGRDGAL